MGHSEDINKDIYQAPLAIMRITKVGKQLMQIDGGDIPASSPLGEDIDSLFSGNDQITEKKEMKSNSKKKNKKKFKRVFIESDSDYSNASGIEEDSESQKYGQSEPDRERQRKVLKRKGEECNNSDLNKFLVGKNAKWTVNGRHELFMKRFGSYVERSQPNPMPGREEMEDFLDDIGRPFGRDKVRIKLNNERKIADERKKMRLAKIGV